MGCCFSFSATEYSVSGTKTARVIALDDSLKEHSVPVTAGDVLGPNRWSAFFLCSLDRLFFDTHIPPLSPQDPLEPRQIYFVLPTAMLDYPLSGSDMAELAIKAGRALAAASSKQGRSRRIRVMPVAEFRDGFEENRFVLSASRSSLSLEGKKKKKKKKKKKIGRLATFKPNMAYRRTKLMRLGTIEENDEQILTQF